MDSSDLETINSSNFWKSDQKKKKEGNILFEIISNSVASTNEKYLYAGIVRLPGSRG